MRPHEVQTHTGSSDDAIDSSGEVTILLDESSTEDSLDDVAWSHDDVTRSFDDDTGLMDLLDGVAGSFDKSSDSCDEVSDSWKHFTGSS